MIEVNKNETKVLDNGYKLIFFILTDAQGNEYRWHAQIPADVDEQKWAEENEDMILLLIRRREYPDMPQEIQTLEDAEKWIKNGCKIKVEIGVDENGEPVYEEEVAEKQKFRNTW